MDQTAQKAAADFLAASNPKTGPVDEMFYRLAALKPQETFLGHLPTNPVDFRVEIQIRIWQANLQKEKLQERQKPPKSPPPPQ